MNSKWGPFGHFDDTTVILILRSLGTADRISMRSVAFRFKKLIDENMPINVTELLVCPDLFRLRNNRWEGTSQIIDYHTSLVRGANFDPKPAALQGLRKLKMVSTADYKFLRSLQVFGELQHLEMIDFQIQEKMEMVKLFYLRFFGVEKVSAPVGMGRPDVQLRLQTPLLRDVSFDHPISRVLPC